MSLRANLKGFPVQQMVVVALIRFSEPLSFTSLFPYLYFMIRDLHIAKEEKDISKYSGYLASCYAFCQFLFSVRWGQISDRVGRKPVLMFGLVGTSISLVVFGFSKNYYWAVAARCLSGCLNGNIGVLRTMVGEIATDRRHQATAFLILPLLFNFGSIIGPLIGGYFTHPKEHSPYESKIVYSQTKTFFDKYPYALSNIIVASCIWFSVICAFLFLEETNAKFKHRRDYGLDIGDLFLNWCGFKTKRRPWHITLSESRPLLSNKTIRAINNPEDPDDLQINEPQLEYNAEQPVSPQLSNVSEPVFNKQVILSISSNFILAMHGIIYAEFTPVFLGSPYNSAIKFPFKISGGFGLKPSTIGGLFSSTGMIGMLIIMIIFPWLDHKLGTLRGYRFSLSLLPFVYFFLPLSIFTLNKYNPILPPWFVLVCLYTLTSLRTLAVATGLPQIMLLNHRAAATQHRAYVNGFTMSMLALARFIGPTVFGYLMSLGNKMYMGWLGWWCISSLALCGFLQSFFLVDSDN